MENFILYNAASEKDQVTFEVSWVHFQRIGRGTNGMIMEMLKDLGLSHVKVVEWALQKYFSNYLSDEPDSDDWELVGNNTVEIVVTLDRPAKLNGKETDLTRTYARDTTWRSREPVQYPANGVVVADFYEDCVLDRAEV